MARRGSLCGICDGVNQPAVCQNCSNVRLSEKYKILKRVLAHRDDVKRRLEAQLAAKREAESQRKWRAEHTERKAKLREQLRNCSNELMKARARGDEQKKRLDARTNALASASAELAARQTHTLGKYYPDLICTKTLSFETLNAELVQKRRLQLRQLCKILPIRRCTGDERENRGGTGHPVRICNVELPLGDDPSSVPHNDLGAALGYMVQLVNLTARYLSAPLLHSAGFAASSSRIWQRASYWDTRPAHRGEEYPLFLPRENGASVEDPNHGGASSQSNVNLSFTEGSRSFGRELDADASLVRCSSSSLSGTSTSREVYRDVQKGIKMLKRSVACINTYGYRLLSLAVPSDLSTFEAFAELLAILTSKEPRARSSRGSQQPNGRFGLSEGHVARMASCPPSMLEEVKPVSDILEPSAFSRGKVKSWNEFVDIGESEHIEDRERVSESLFDGWDLVEHPTLPPPSDSEDIEQWTRAMFIDATKRSRADVILQGKGKFLRPLNAGDPVGGCANTNQAFWCGVKPETDSTSKF
ncbi:hypothetical protein R1sor_002602 [Riccia sorocarpa]|uniref:Uncharacterized protein n=1 Tax=Riccia sorocarpa TaxID=122646 RepID=A0ABD3H2P6_9MARC